MVDDFWGRLNFHLRHYFYCMKNISFLLFFFFYISGRIYSQSNYNFRTINKDDGLIDNYVEQVYEDSRGFIWFGTQGGLSRYDGHSFLNIEIPQNLSSDKSGLSGNSINTIIEDDEQNLWIGTQAGLYVYNLSSGIFTTIGNDFAHGFSQDHDFIEEIVIDKSNNPWIGTRDGLCFYNKKTKKCQHFSHKENDTSSLSGNYIESLCIDHNDDVWVGTRNNGLEKLSKDKKTFEHFKLISNGNNNLHIRNIIEDSKQNIWILTSDGGLFCKAQTSQQFSKIDLYIPNTKKIFNTVFRNICEDKFGNLWIGSLTDGVIIYNQEKKTCTFITENTNIPYHLSANSIHKISCDKLGNIWLATHGAGVNLYNPTNQWVSYFSKSETKQCLPGNIVSSFCEDSKGTMWIGTDGNGLAKFDKTTGLFELFSKEEGLSSNAVLAIVEIKPNMLAVATWVGGLNIFNTTSKIFTQYLYPSSNIDGTRQKIFSLHLDKAKGLLWCNTQSEGIQIFNCKTMQFLNKNELLNECPHADISKYSFKTLIDNDKNIWIADASDLYRIKGKKVYNYSISKNAKKGTCINNVKDLILDSHGTIWASSFNGVFRYNKKNDRFEALTFTNIDFSKAFGLLEDSTGNIWISTLNALFKYSTNNNNIETISNKWGMPQMQYFRSSTYRTRDGQLYFGGLNGFVILEEKGNTTIINPNFYITGLYINGKKQLASDTNAILRKDISYLSNIELNYNHNFITIEFGAMNFIDNKKSKFKYQLKGFNNSWIETGNDRKVQFTNIPPGNYSFLLKSTDSEGKWMEKTVCLQITILPPWWKTLWFRMLLTSIFIVVVWYYIRVKINKIKTINKQLEALVDIRTKELKTTNLNLEKQKETIQSQYNDIMENHFVIQLKNNQLQDALEMKDKLMTVIAHDFKNPLSSLQGILKFLQKKVQIQDFKDLEKGIDLAVTSSTQLMDQMISILDWSLGNDKTITHIPIDTNISNILADVLSLINESASRKDISIHVKNTCSHATFVDPRMLSAIIRNILINSIKFTNEKGKIEIFVNENNNYIVCEIKDNGIGMDADFIAKLLSSDELQAEDYQSGFGLMICKAFIKRNKGILEIDSQLNKGTCFKISFPKGELLKNVESPIKTEISEHSFEIGNTEMSMLIIDDNKDIIGYLSEVFAENFTVYGTYNGEKGLQIAHNIVPDIILSDVHMPLLDGLNLCKSIKSNSLTSHIPVILISAKNLQADQIEGLLSGADDYITKPFDIAILKQKVNAIIKNRQLLKQHSLQNTATIDKAELTDSHNDKITKEATELILKNINNPDFTVEELSKQLFLSRSQLYRKFIGVYGQTPKEYILTLKFEKAIEMLKTKKHKVSDIAFELGFTDSHYFSTSFTQRFGVSPSNYFPKEHNSIVDDK